MTTYYSLPSGSSFINGTIRVYQKIISHISPSPRECMKGENISHTTHSCFWAIIHLTTCSMMDNYLCFIVVVFPRPYKFMSIKKFYRLIDRYIVGVCFFQKRTPFSFKFLSLFSRGKFSSWIISSFL